MRPSRVRATGERGGETGTGTLAILRSVLGRYHIVRGKRPPGDPLPEGVRQDTRKHTRHVLRPETELVQRYLDAPGDAAWRAFAAAYRRTLASRFAEDRVAFDRLAGIARDEDLWIGCNCPTAKNPDVRRCHTFLALEFLHEKYPDVEILWPV